jgi:hypothetical protein
MKDHHARGPEETVQDLPAVVSAGPANWRAAARLRQTGVPDIAGQKTQANWRKRNPEYGAAYRIQQRAIARDPPAEPLRMPLRLEFHQLERRWEHFLSAVQSPIVGDGALS